MSGRAGPDSHFDWAECVGGKELAQCLWLIEHRWRSEVAGPQRLFDGSSSENEPPDPTSAFLWNQQAAEDHASEKHRDDRLSPPRNETIMVLTPSHLLVQKFPVAFAASLLSTMYRDTCRSLRQRDQNGHSKRRRYQCRLPEFFASRPLGIAELFTDPIVRMRIGGYSRFSDLPARD
jgi:hypothetical protein